MCLVKTKSDELLLTAAREASLPSGYRLEWRGPPY